MEYVFTINDESVLGQAKQVRDTQKDNNDVDMYCDSIGSAVSGWTPGQTYKVVFGYKFKEEINDGWDTFAPADNLYIFWITAAP
jgi:hypothetical protein